MTLVRNELNYSIVCTAETAFECQAISVQTQAGTLTVINVYMSPSVVLSNEHYDAFRGLLVHRNTVLVGDLNAYHPIWGSKQVNPRGETLFSVITDTEYVVLNSGQPTRMHFTGSVSHLDVSLASKEIAGKCTWNVCDNAMGSDHYPIVVRINERPVREQHYNPRWKLDKADWLLFRTACGVSLTLEKTYSDDTDTFNDNVSQAIIAAAEKAVPRTSCKASKRNKPLPYWNDEIKEALAARNRLNRPSESHCPENCQVCCTAMLANILRYA
jgi:hypothetical protein